MDLTLLRADTVTRADVRVSRDGWITEKRYDSLVGHVYEDGTNVIGQVIWRAQASDVFGWSFKRTDSIATVIELHNMQEKARAYDLLIRRLDRPGASS